jgi:hypothetical protein
MSFLVFAWVNCFHFLMGLLLRGIKFATGTGVVGSNLCCLDCNANCVAGTKKAPMNLPKTYVFDVKVTQFSTRACVCGWHTHM